MFRSKLVWSAGQACVRCHSRAPASVAAARLATRRRPSAVITDCGSKPASRSRARLARPAATKAGNWTSASASAQTRPHVLRPRVVGPPHQVHDRAARGGAVARGFVRDPRPADLLRPLIGVGTDAWSPLSASHRATSSATRPTAAPQTGAVAARPLASRGVTRQTPCRVSKKSAAANERSARSPKM